MIDIKAIKAADLNFHSPHRITAPTVIALCDEIERLRSTINEFHHAIKDAGWHPGRTDDLLTDIIRAKGVEIERLRKEIEADERNLCQLTDELAACRNDAARYQWLAAYFVSDRTDQDDAIVSASEVGVEQVTAVIDAAMQNGGAYVVD